MIQGVRILLSLSALSCTTVTARLTRPTFSAGNNGQLLRHALPVADFRVRSADGAAHPLGAAPSALSTRNGSLSEDLWLEFELQ